MSFGTVQAEKMTTESGYSLGAGNATSFKNRLINGGMDIDQRNAGASVQIVGGSPKYGPDRFIADLSTSTGVVYSVQQVADAPAGFNYSMRATVTTAGSTASGNYSYIRQQIEGFNFADMNFGTANAKSFTLSFWVKASITGTYGGYFGAALNARFQVFSFTVNAANTWEFKTVTIAGDTSGTWNKTNGVGLQVAWSLSCGSSYTGSPGSWSNSLLLGVTGQVNITETNGATFAITGCQLEVGTVATSFDSRDYGRELMLCQRYFAKSYNQAVALATPDSFSGAPGRFVDATSNYASVQVFFPVRMRTTPTVTIYNPSTGATASLRSDVANHPAGVTQQGEAGCWFFAQDSTITTSVSCRAHYGASAEL